MPDPRITLTPAAVKAAAEIVGAHLPGVQYPDNLAAQILLAALPLCEVATSATVTATVWVCDACGTEACWQGIFMCDDAARAGVRKEARVMMAAGPQAERAVNIQRAIDRVAHTAAAAQAKAASMAVTAERERLKTVIAERFKEVLAYPANGYLVDAVPWAHLLDLLGPGADLLRPGPCTDPACPATPKPHERGGWCPQ